VLELVDGKKNSYSVREALSNDQSDWKTTNHASGVGIYMPSAKKSKMSFGTVDYSDVSCGFILYGR